MEEEDYKRIYTGPTVIIKMLQSRLEEVNIYPIVKDNLSSGTWGGFGGVPGLIQLFVHQDEYEKAKLIVDDALKNINQD
ncbi:DUF2007 domain-containing protein [uncultured Planktosalinus sp.]|uniref:putative signal transducing protein n=1 Tax=uncultured Planktosalinus sp. TaxID=1810935 RepID=UPI0030DCBD66|tara:strand:+ start:39 stop:275 length:237 start_codon:yes stop_codon:yes gene_type:complete